MLFYRKKTSKTSDEKAMHEVMLLLDEWKAPEPSSWFDARMMARFREEQERAPVGLLARLQNRWLLTQHVISRPLMAGAMALLVMAGGSSYWELSQHQHHLQPSTVSATVQDLQVLDSNEQAIQQMGLLLDDNDDTTPQS